MGYDNNRNPSAEFGYWIPQVLLILKNVSNLKNKKIEMTQNTMACYEVQIIQWNQKKIFMQIIFEREWKWVYGLIVPYQYDSIGIMCMVES